MPIIQTNKELRPRDVNDTYPTPISHIRAALRLIPDYDLWQPDRVLDPGAGDGAWGKQIRKTNPESFIVGTELRTQMEVEGQIFDLRSSAYNQWVTGDFLETTLADYDGYQFDLVVGNPPYKFAEKFLRHSFYLLKEGGHMVQLLRLAFLEGQARNKGFWREFPPLHIGVCSDRPSFTGVWKINYTTGEPYFVADGKTDATAYAYFIWQKGWAGTPTLSFVHSDDFREVENLTYA